MKLYLVLMALVLVSACATGSSIKDCGSDQECLTDAIKTCIPAKGQIDYTQDNYLYIEVKGKEANKCVVYENLEGPGVSEALEQLQSMTGKVYSKLDITCRIPMDATQAGVMKEYDEISDYCEGSLLDYLEFALSSLMNINQ